MKIIEKFIENYMRKGFMTSGVKGSLEHMCFFTLDFDLLFKYVICKVPKFVLKFVPSMLDGEYFVSYNYFNKPANQFAHY